MASTAKTKETLDAQMEATRQELGRLRLAYMELDAQRTEVERRLHQLDGALQGLSKLRADLFEGPKKG